LPVLYISRSLQTALGFDPGIEGVDGEEGQSESFLGDDDQADSLILVLEDPGLTDQHHYPANHKDCGDDQLVLEDPLEILHIHFNFIY